MPPRRRRGPAAAAQPVPLAATAAIDDALEVRLSEYSERTQSVPTRSEKRKLKEQTREELLPKAFVKSQRTSGFAIASDRMIAVDALPDARAEHFLEHLRSSVGGLEAVPLGFNRSVSELLMRIFLGDAPRDFVLGRDCRMCDPSDTKASIRCADMDLSDPAVHKHVREGMRLTHLGVEFANVLSCTIDETGGVAKLKIVGTDVDEDLPDEDPLARLDAEFALLTGTLRQLLSALQKSLGGYNDEPAPVERMAVGA